MRKQVLFGAALLALGTAVVSCSKDEVVVDNTPGVETPVAEGEQEIILQVANTGDGLTTRAVRPLFSSEAKQTIDKVKVVIVDGNGTVVSVKVFTNWSTDAVSQVYTTDGHGRKATWKLTGAERLAANGTYRVYAVGYTSTGSLYTEGISAFEALSTSGGSNTFDSFVSKITATTVEGEEIFAGEIASITTDDEGNFDLTTGGASNVLTLHRQVAGVMGYFTSIPVYSAADAATAATQQAGDSEPDKYQVKNLTGYEVRLVSSNMSNKIILEGFNSDFVNTGDNVEFKVNGIMTTETAGPNPDVAKTQNFYNSDLTKVNNGGADAYEVFTIDLSKWFPNGDVNNDGLLNDLDAEDYTTNGNWDTPASVQGASFAPGSVFSGKFVIPFAKAINTQTLQLQLVGKGIQDNALSEDIKVLRVWNINLPSDDAQLYPTAGHALVWDGTTENVTENNFVPLEGAGAGENKTSYSLVRNHLYGIGAKATDEYNPDEDEPQDLSTGQNLILQVNDNWELIHKMEIE